jgi:RNA polymerase sigma-70 factor (ECF subfamily)
MRGGRLERQFERWRRKRDVRSLARVFDATARELLELAGHLSHDPSEAEDLVQATFLAAIESADRFDAERDLVAWLVGILVREARMARRRAARRPDPQRLSERAEADPADAVEQLELSAVLRAALERLPSPYREVVGPYVRDGASPSHIARELGRSPGTVRVQIHRGLELVRRGLPAGAVAAVLAALPTRGLAAIRESVLGRASGLASSSLATGTAATALVPLGLGGIAVKKLVFAAGIAAVGTVAWNLLATDPRARSTFPGERAEAAEALARPAPVENAGAPASIAAPGSIAVRTDETPIAVAEPSATAGLRVHLAWASDGSPAAGVGARLGRIEGAAQEGERESIADQQGVATFEDVPAGAHSVRLDRVQVMENVDLEAGAVRDLRIAVPDGLTVQGRVVDAEGNGLAGAEVLLSEPWSLGGMLSVGTSANDGSFQIRGATANSTVGARLAGWAPALQPILHPSLAGAGPIVEVDVVLDQRAGSIAGRVLDADGKPLCGAHLSAAIEMWEANEGGQSVSIRMVTRSDGWVCRPAAPITATTGANGSFTLADVETGDVEVRVRSSPSKEASAPFPEWRQRTEVRAGETTQLEIRMARGASVEGIVRLSDGTPAAGVEVYAIDGKAPIGQWAHSDATGHYSIHGLNAGEIALSVNDSIRLGHAQTKSKLALADGEAATWDVTLPKAALLAGVAVGEDWKALAGWTVRIAMVERAGYEWWEVTDADGRFQLQADDSETYDLQLLPVDFDRAADRQAIPHAWVQGARPGDEIVLEVSEATRPSARVRGVLLGPDGAPCAGGHVSLSRTEFPWIQVSAKYSMQDGAFEAEPLPPGLYSILYAAADSSQETSWVQLEANEVLDAGVKHLQAPGDLVVRARLPEGVAAEEVKVMLRGHGNERELDLLPSGAWLSRNVPAGPLVLTAEAPGCAQVRRDLQLEQGGSAEVEVELARGAACPILVVLPPSVREKVYVHITVRDAAGAIQQSFAEAMDGSEPVERLVLPPGEWRVEARENSEGWTGAAQVMVAAIDRSLPALTIALEPPR